jgi:hypothetical protein
MPQSGDRHGFTDYSRCEEIFFTADSCFVCKTSLSLKRAILLQRKSRRDEMNSTKRLTGELMMTAFPPLQQVEPEVADRGTVRLGSGCITAGFPPLRQPKPEVTDRGTVRLGSGCITAGFALRR